jgi:tetratricopeptide (TPR) repeat protein
VVLGAAVDDLYEMNEYPLAIATGQQLIAQYPACDPLIRRSAWAAVAHSFFDTSNYAQAEHAYARVLEMTREDEETHSAVVDNLAAAIYKQGEAARLAEDYQTAADHFLRITEVTPTSEIRPAAEYDAGAALIQLENWSAAAAVLEAFRENHPEHELQHDVTRQIANVYRSDGDLSRAAREYRRVAGEADDAELRAEALLLAGELYQDAKENDEALAVYLDYVSRFPTPLETALETRFKIAEIYRSSGDELAYHDQLRSIVAADRSAGEARTDRIRYLAARSALVMSEDVYRQFDEIALIQPFEKNLRRKQRSMDATLESFGSLVAYEVAEVTAAATFYIGEVYFNFSLSLLESERPDDLDANEMLDYEMVLEEEAFPFEERAIDVHEKNLELMSAGVYNAWIEKSLLKLADLMPGRYAKFEASSGLIASIDTYAYRAPNARGAVADEAGIDQPTEPGEPPARSDPEPDAAPESGEPARQAVEAG